MLNSEIKKSHIEALAEQPAIAEFMPIAIAAVRAIDPEAKSISNLSEILSEEVEPAYYNAYLEYKFASYIAVMAEQYGIGAEAVEPFKEGLFAKTDPAELQIAFMNLCVVVNWYLSKNKTFHFSRELSDQLGHTQMNALSILVKLPYQSIQMIYEAEAVKRLFARSLGKEELINNKPVTVSATESSSKAGRKVIFVCYQGTDALVKREIHLEDGDINQALGTDWDELGDVADNVDLMSNYLMTEGEQETLIPFIRLLINSILYLSSSEPDIINTLAPKKELEERLAKAQKNSKKKALKKQIKQVTAYGSSRVGSRITPIYKHKRSSGEKLDASQLTSHMKHLTIFPVRGHWRVQRYGEGGEQRKLNWIAPYIKGDPSKDMRKDYIVR